MMNFITKPVTLWCLFGLFILETLGFGVIMAIWDFTIIDEMSDPEKIRLHIGEMSDTQRAVHAWMTATLDVVYPLTYGLLFAGLSLRAFPKFMSIPAIAVIPTDLAEGAIQVMVLTGTYDLLWLKALVTPLKLLLFVVAIAVAISAVVLGIRTRQRRKS